MAFVSQPQSSLRARPAIAAAAVEAVLAVAIVLGLSSGFQSPPLTQPEVTSLKALPPDRPPQPQPSESGEREKNAAAPPAPKNESSAIVAPKPKIVVTPPPVVAATVAGTGSAAAAGAANAGTGSGAGGVGDGTGGGGTGNGGTGGARAAQRIAGGLRDSDYPDWAKPVRAQGTVFVAFTVEPSGRVSGCRATRSSGYGELDALTCRLIEKRFRYRPALDRNGSPVSTTVNTNFTWMPRG